MKRALALAMTALPALPVSPQSPRPERIESCVDALLLTGERHDFAAGPAGWGGALDWIGCLPRTVYTAGAASFSIADTRWSIAKLGASFQPLPDLWIAADVKAGGGRNPAGDFRHLQLTDSLTVRMAAPIFVKVEHQYIRIGAERGHILKLLGVFVPLPSLAVESGVARSANATFDTRQATARVDWVHSAGRVFGGVAFGRSIPQAVDVVTGARVPDTVTRQWFAGVVHAWGRYELGLVHDLQRTVFSRRRTWTATLRLALP